MSAALFPVRCVHIPGLAVCKGQGMSVTWMHTINPCFIYFHIIVHNKMFNTIVVTLIQEN